MKRVGCELIRHGAKHDWYRNPITGEFRAVPRHREINERLAQRMIHTLRDPKDATSAETAPDPAPRRLRPAAALPVEPRGLLGGPARRTSATVEGGEDLRVIREGGWHGPVGILDHAPEVDAEARSRANLDGLRRLVDRLDPEGSDPGAAP